MVCIRRVYYPSPPGLGNCSNVTVFDYKLFVDDIFIRVKKSAHE